VTAEALKRLDRCVSLTAKTLAAALAAAAARPSLFAGRLLQP